MAKKITVQAISKEAKKMYKKGGSKKWTTCIKEASQKLKNK